MNTNRTASHRPSPADVRDYEDMTRVCAVRTCRALFPVKRDSDSECPACVAQGWDAYTITVAEEIADR